MNQTRALIYFPSLYIVDTCVKWIAPYSNSIFKLSLFIFMLYNGMTHQPPHTRCLVQSHVRYILLIKYFRHHAPGTASTDLLDRM